MPDAVIFAPKDRVQDVKKAVELLKAKDVAQAEVFPKDPCPWGWFESLALGECFQVKRICMKPGASLGLQSHNHSSEYCIVLEGKAEEDVKLEAEGQSVCVPWGAVHRMENPGKLPMLLIDVQIGSYLREEDITRYVYTYNKKSIRQEKI